MFENLNRAVGKLKFPVNYWLFILDKIRFPIKKKHFLENVSNGDNGNIISKPHPKNPQLLLSKFSQRWNSHFKV